MSKILCIVPHHGLALFQHDDESHLEECPFGVNIEKDDGTVVFYPTVSLDAVRYRSAEELISWASHATVLHEGICIEQYLTPLIESMCAHSNLSFAAIVCKIVVLLQKYGLWKDRYADQILAVPDTIRERALCEQLKKSFYE